MIIIRKIASFLVKAEAMAQTALRWLKREYSINLTEKQNKILFKYYNGVNTLIFVDSILICKAEDNVYIYIYIYIYII